MPRKHITTACTACRESKIRCDGKQPRCDHCIAKAKECRYQQGEDKRKLSVQKAIKIFSRRVNQLEDFIRAHELEVPPNESNEDALMINKMMKTLPNSSSRESSNNDDTITIPAPTPAEPRDIPSTTNLADLIVVQEAAPASHKTSISLIETTGDLTPSSEGSPNNIYDLPHDSNDALPSIRDEVDLDGMTIFTMDTLNFPERAIDFSDLNPLSLGANPFNWDQLRQPYLAHPNIDFSMPPPSSSRDSWHLPHYDSNISGEDSGDEEEDDVVNQVSDRMGSLHLYEGGELRFYGATSNLTLLDDTSLLNYRHDLDANNVRKRGQAMIEAAGLAQNVSQTLVQHLSSLYFAWQDPSFHVVDKDMYERQQTQYNNGTDDSTFFSETLMNTICAFGALYDGRRHGDLPTPLSEFFMKRAKIWLEVELDSPRVATVQALVILSSFEAAQTRDARGWLYSGMSMRLSFDLGLHIDMTPYVSSGRMSAEEAEVRKVTFWGSYIVDHLWGFYLGRPPFHINTEEISVQKPAEHLHASKLREWTPYGLSKSASIRPLVDPLELIVRQWVLLCDVMGTYCHVLYDRHDVGDTFLQSVVQDTVSKLEAWKSNLPPELQVDLEHNGTIYLPHVLILHMKYYQSMIYIHRPFISRQGSRSFAPTIDRGYLHARKVCIESAIAISNILRIYRTTCTFRYTNVEVVSIIFSAAVILVFASLTSPPLHQIPHPGSSPVTGNSSAGGGRGSGGGSISMHLDTCCKALADLGRVFQNATRTLEVLLAIKRKWQAELLVSTGSKRRSSAVSRPGTGCKKRTMSHPHESSLAI
ncbi:fungal-specific transcription factor domain-containing protein [Xylogone sp. PMI_703]|nr:fungal-specific transcription factor domain-containing protein [Xylogone sp. PMI_703]